MERLLIVDGRACYAQVLHQFGCSVVLLSRRYGLCQLLIFCLERGTIKGIAQLKLTVCWGLNIL
jgi:hypothetical protein